MVLPTPNIIQESVAGSHLALWGQPQFTRSGMLLFTCLFGFFGLHHVMLRSPLTGLVFFLLNASLGGYWYFFDILQLFLTSEDDLNTYGLASPLLIEYGIAVGMWEGGTKERGRNADKAHNPVTQYLFEKHGKDRENYSRVMAAKKESSTSVPGEPSAGPPTTTQRGGAAPSPPPSDKAGAGTLKETAGLLAESALKIIIGWVLSSRKKEKPKEYNWEDPPPSAWWTLVFLLTTPMEMVSSAVAGDMWACFFHFISLFIFGLFLWPVILVRSIAVSIFTLLFPIDVFIQGVSRPFPFVQLFNEIDVNGRSERIQRSRINEVDPEAGMKSIEPFTNLFRQGIGLTEGLIAYVPLALGGRIGGALDKFANASVIAAQKSPAAPPVPEAQPAIAKPSVQKGGSRESSLQLNPDSLSLGVIGAVLLGGLLIGVSRNGFQGKDDSPPNTGRF
jgi:TM2 domain-containing membrane protein YozV